MKVLTQGHIRVSHGRDVDPCFSTFVVVRRQNYPVQEMIPHIVFFFLFFKIFFSFMSRVSQLQVLVPSDFLLMNPERKPCNMIGYSPLGV